MQTKWNAQWNNEADRAYWNTPDKHVIKFSDSHSIGDGDTVLDLGCGVGRHAIYLAQRGARVHAIDESETAVKKLTESAGSLLVDIKTDVCNYLSLQPVKKYDYIIAFNVIYHGDASHFGQSVNKCRGLLKPNGRLFFTCPTRKDGKYGNGNKVDEHTYESLNSVHPGDVHYFTDEAELYDLLCKFKGVTIEKDEYYWDNNGVRQFASNYIVVACKS